MTDNTPNVSAAHATRWIGDALCAAGVGSEDASAIAAVLVRASLRGVDTHGISRLPQYIEGIRDGTIIAAPARRVETHEGVLHVHGGGGIGQLTGIVATDAAIAVAREKAVVACAIHEAGHLGALGLYVLRAAERGLVGFICQATPPLMSLAGFKGRAIGNNPLAFATPVASDVPLVFDMASSLAAKGRVRQAIREGTPIGDDWAIDPQGNPTTDPQAAWDGAMLPVGGHKGLGLAMMVQVLAASLVGSSAGLLDEGRAFSQMSAFMLLIDPDKASLGGFEADMTVWLDHYLHVADSGGRYPGQGAARIEAERHQSGIPFPSGLAGQFDAVAEALDIAPLVPASY